MAILNINKKEFEKDIGKFDEKMQEKIALFGTPIESLTEEQIQLEIFPNRPDLLSYQNYKRSFLAFLNKKVGMKNYQIKKPEKNFQVIIDPSVKNIRPFTACAIIKNLNLTEERIKEIIDMQEKLHFTIGRKRKKIAIGIYPFDKIKFPITFKALEPEKIKFIPLEFEREMSGLEILQKHPTGKEYSHLLAGKIKFPIFVDSTGNILSMPPIINSQLTGKVTEKTKDIFVECSGFDFDILKKCLNILISTFGEMGGSIYQVELKYPKKELTPNFTIEKMKINLDKVNKLLGLNLTEKQIKNLLNQMEFEYSSNKVSIPPWRMDILHEVDLVEDIAISYGYDKFIPEIPEVSTIGVENQKEVIKRKISEILVGLNFLEISNYHLTTKENQFIKMNIPEKPILLENSKTEFNILRENLSHYSLKILSENVDVEYPQKIFEIGTVFKDCNEITENENLCLSIVPGNFTELKQVIEYLSKMLNIEFKYLESEKIPSYFIDGRTSSIIFQNKSIGFMGEIHPKILKNWKIKMPVVLAEIDIEEICKNI